MIQDLKEAKDALETLYSKVRSASRLTRSELLGVLSVVYSIQLSVADRVELFEYVVAHRKTEGANRAFLLATDNEFTLPLRYVFPSSRDRTNVSRYAGALRELKARGTPQEKFEETVKSAGGLVDLYWCDRTRQTKRMVRSKLTLDRNIECVSGQEITLRLLPSPSGVFQVLECKTPPATTAGGAPDQVEPRG